MRRKKSFFFPRLQLRISTKNYWRIKLQRFSELLILGTLHMAPASYRHFPRNKRRHQVREIKMDEDLEERISRASWIN